MAIFKFTRFALRPRPKQTANSSPAANGRLELQILRANAATLTALDSLAIGDSSAAMLALNAARSDLVSAFAEVTRG